MNDLFLTLENHRGATALKSPRHDEKLVTEFVDAKTQKLSMHQGIFFAHGAGQVVKDVN